MTRRALLVRSLAVGVLVGVGFPLLELLVECRDRTSEACVWDRALLPLSLGIGVVLGLAGGTVGYFVLRSRRAPPPDA